ncbi:hypothetical protein Scep_005895 [Stephania cephalantha]|uniref:WRKY domain-containing protein n=1 Tax=Stephania cephalantha TaxID=152367 RepID=A0AAP0KV70_9MAGN
MEYCSSQAWPEAVRQSSVGRAKEELIIGRDTMSELQTLLRKAPGERGSSEVDLTNKVLLAIDTALSILNSGDWKFCDVPVGSPSSVDQKMEDPAGGKRKNPVSKDRRGGYKRRKVAQTWTKLTATQVDDGFAWRKYGQKEILNAKHPRNYFRCTHKHDQGCQATKQVQITEEEPPMYRTIYMGHHTCRDTIRAPRLVSDSDSYPDDSTCLLNFQSSDASPTTRKQGYGAFFTSSISSAHVKPESDLTAHNLSRSSEYIPVQSPDLTSFESSGPSNMLAGTTSGSEYGDVISGVYSSCNTASSDDQQSLNMDDFFVGHDFEDFQFDEELHQCMGT